MRTNTNITQAFVEGKCKKQGANQSTGQALYYHGNKIAEWRNGDLFISNGGYEGSKGETGSKTTKDKLNVLPNVNLSQRNFKWILNGVEWDGDWIKIDGVKAPAIDEEKGKDVFVTEKQWISSGGRGYYEPTYACAGANDTGTYSDSPCPSHVAESELKSIISLLEKEKIKVKIVTCETSNVFCVHHYLVPKLKDVARAREITKDFLTKEDTRLAYLVE
jgi:hypothetical protein